MADFFDEQRFDNGLQEGIDFYLNCNGFRVLTARYLKERGWCCGNGCLYCPYQPRAIKGNTHLRLPD